MAPTNRRDELVEAAREVARRLGTETLSLREFQRETGIGDGPVYRCFESWVDLCLEAGLKVGYRSTRRLSDDEIFSAMRDAFLEMGGIGNRRKFQRHFRHGANVLRRRRLTWTAALFAFREWAERRAPDFPYMDQLPDAAPPRDVWPAGESRTLGAVINYRALLHAPVNEQGVVALFAMMAEDLGFAIVSLATGFPDCEANRRVAGGRWQRVTIEFEFQSRNFRDHGHDANGCNVIVCWEHNWTDCPLEVVELKAEVAALRAREPLASRHPVP